MAENFLENENFNDALPLFLYLDSIDSNNDNLKYKVGLCYLYSASNKKEAISYLSQASTNVSQNYKKNDRKETFAPITAYKYLAKAYQINYEFDNAIAMYLKYKELLGTGKKITKEVEMIMYNIEACTIGIELINDPKEVIISNLGVGVNSVESEYSPVLMENGKVLLFTSRRYNTIEDIKNKRGQYDEDIYISFFSDNKWQPSVLITGEVNTSGNDRIINSSYDEKTLIIFKDDGNDGNLYLSRLLNGRWKTPHYWGSGINSVADESYASFTIDGRMLYFTSDREGGFGGTDIYKCLRLPNGRWGPAQNLGPVINTKYDEEGVFVHPNGKEIFFSSEGHKSMGGFDVFSSVIDIENGFLSEPLNLGYPINTTGHDLFYKTSSKGNIAIISSDREEGYGNKDIYEIVFPKKGEKRDITLIVGRIINNTNEDLSDNLILLIDKATKETILEVVANSATGKFGMDLPIGGVYEIQYYVKGKEIYNETIKNIKR